MTHEMIRVLSAALLLVGATQAAESEATRLLKARNAEFEKEIIEVTDGVYTAIGWNASANSMIIGDDGVIIVDPGQNVQWSREVRAEFEKITDKPVKAIVYTHGHGDHTNGARAFLDPGAQVEVWARSNYGSEGRQASEKGLGGGSRLVSTQGFDLPPEKRINNGVAPALYPGGAFTPGGQRRPGGIASRRGGEGGRSGSVEPTRTFDRDRLRLTIAGVRLELVAAPGETADHLYVWLPDKKVLFAGDNFYKSFPNVYPLRGLARRSFRDWTDSLHKMLQENPDHLVGGHTRPIVGRSQTTAALSNLYGAMRHVWEKTIEGINQAMTPDELVEYVQLPEHLADNDYLRNYYGSLPHTVRDLYAQHMGWFDGNPLNLHRPSPREQAQQMADLAGGPAALLEKARGALQAERPYFAGQLAWAAITLDPDAPEPKLLLADALDVLGEGTLNAPTRNYTLAYALLLRRQAGGD